MTPAELKRRRKFLGGSEVAACDGSSPFQTAAGLWDEKRGLVEPKKPTEAMKKGIFYEDGIAKHWASNWADANPGQKLIVRRHKALVYPQNKIFRASPDRIITFPDGHQEGLEIKCINEFSEAAGGWGRSGSQDYPMYYRIQCAWNRMIFDLPQWNLVALVLKCGDKHTGAPLKHYVYKPDLKFEAHLRDIGNEFWHNHVLTGIRPEEKPTHRLTSPDVPDILKTIEAPPTWAATL